MLIPKGEKRKKILSFPNNKQTMEGLPPELFLEIISYLLPDLNSILSCLMVCRRWNLQISSADYLWTSLIRSVLSQSHRQFTSTLT